MAEICIDESRRLRALASQIRARVIESKLSLALTLCALAETEIRYYDQPENAQGLVQKIRETTESVRLHLALLSHVPQSSVAELRRHLARLVIFVKLRLHCGDSCVNLGF